MGLSFGALGFGLGGATQIVAYAADLRFDSQEMTLCERLSQLPQADPGIRAQIDEAAMRHGWPVLHARIAQRFDAMLTAGLIDEVRALREKYALDAALPSMRCVGYRQVWGLFDGELAQDELRERGIYATRQLAKRQLTWMRAMPDLEVFDCCDPTGASSFASRVAAWLSGGSAR